MRPNGSLDAPIVLDDDEPSSYVPRTTVRRRNRQTLEQDGIEEVSHAREAAAEWKLAAAKRQAKQRNLRNLGNDMSERDGNTRDSNLAKQAREKTSPAEPAGVADLVINEEAAALGGITQHEASTRDDQLPADTTQKPISQSNTHHEAVLPQRAKPPGPVQQTGLDQPFLMESSYLATPVYRSPYGPQPPVTKLPEPSVVLSGAAQPLSWPLNILKARSDRSATAPAIAETNRRVIEPTYSTNSALATSSDAIAPVLSHVEPLPMEPIRDVADNHRERTLLPNRVNTASVRDHAGLDGDDNNMAIPVTAKAPSPSVSAIPKLPRNKKAIKSVKRRNGGFSKPSLPVRLPHHLPRNEKETPEVLSDRPDAGLSDTRLASPLITRRSQSKDPPGDINIVFDTDPVYVEQESIQTERPEERNLIPNPPTLLSHQETQEAVPERTLSTTVPLSRAATPTVQRSVQGSVEPGEASGVLPPDSDTMPANTSKAASFEVIQNGKAQPKNTGGLGKHSDGQASTALPLQTNVLITTRSAVEECLKRHLAERHEEHAYLVSVKMLRQRTFQEQELRARSRKQKRPPKSTLPQRYIQTTSPFQDMSPIQVPFDRSANTKRMLDMSQEVYVKAKPKDTVTKSGLAAPPTKYKSDAPMIPPFKEYVSLRNNILADNESKLLATPYFQDEDYTGREILLDTLPYIYEMTHDENGPLDFRKEQCRFYKDAIEVFLSEIGIAWNDILYWLLAPERNITRINDLAPGSKHFEAHVLERSRYDIEEFERDGVLKRNVLFKRNDRKWREFLPQLKEPSTSALRLAATACAAVLQECEFSIWYLARQSEAVQNHVAKKTACGQAARQSTYKEMLCRVCHQHNCLLHGEIRQAPEDSWKTDSEDEDGATQATDDTSRRGSETKRTPRRISAYGGDDTEDEHEEGPLPAHFDNDSDIERVINYKLPANPDAFNTCPNSEMIASKGAKPPPGKFNANWWLQQDMTQHWEKRKPFFPLNRYNDDVVERNCCNVAIQRGVPRKTLLGHSEVHGFGLYMGEDIKSGDYIGEYTGEAISVKEGDRRVTIYDYQKTMYLFRLNSKQEVDATYMGNKLRFINNADDKYTNCSPKNLLCNTVFRIALFATRDIKAGTELYFNYNYPKEKTAQFKQPNAKAVAVKQTKQKTKKRQSLTSSQPIEDRSRVLAATAKAREAKAAKRAAAQAMLEPSDAQAATKRHSGTLKARKAATGEPGRKIAKESMREALSRNDSTYTDTDTGVDAEAEASDPEIPAVIESQSTQTSQYVQDTEEDNDKYVLTTQEDDEEEDVTEPASDDEQAIVPDRGVGTRTRRGLGRPRKRISDLAPVIAVKDKKTKTKMGGARPGAGRKRKRPIITNSDDE
ncbi:unnamed protein product [Alternaria alternata]